MPTTATGRPRPSDDPNERVIDDGNGGNGRSGEAPSPSPTGDPRGNGIIQVNPHNGGGSGESDGGSGSGNGLKAILAAARSNYQLGKFSEAARGFERAVGIGGGSASNYQRLGDCYRQLGRTGQAIAAYQQAADLHEAGGNAAGAESCRQHIKVLKGG